MHIVNNKIFQEMKTEYEFIPMNASKSGFRASILALMLSKLWPLSAMSLCDTNSFDTLHCHGRILCIYIYIYEDEIDKETHLNFPSELDLITNV